MKNLFSTPRLGGVARFFGADVYLRRRRAVSPMKVSSERKNEAVAGSGIELKETSVTVKTFVSV